MAFAKIYMKNPHTGQLREAPVGFSWTFLIFGGFVGLYRKDYFEGLLWVVGAIITSGLTSLIGGFIYNKRFLKKLLNEGFKVTNATMPIEHISTKLQLPLEVIDAK